MSLDICLVRFVDGNTSDAACEPALSILKAACLDPEAEHFEEIRDVLFLDGSQVEMCASGITSGDRFMDVGFFIRSGGVSPLVVRLMFDLAQASDMVIINTGGEPGNVSNPFVMLTNERQRGDVPSEWVETAVLCASAQQFADVMGAGFDRWHNWAHPAPGNAP